MSNQGSAPVIDVTFDGHKYSQVSANAISAGATVATTLRFTPLNRVNFVIGTTVKCLNSAATIATVQGPWIGTTTADFNVVGFTVIVATGNTVTLTATALGF